MALFGHVAPTVPEVQGAPLVSFGCFSDTQYSCLANRVKIRGPRVRNRYSETSLDLLNQAIEQWKQNNSVSFLLNLGDLTELHEEPGYDRDQCLVQVLNCLEMFPRPTYHVIGHHDLKQFTRKEFMNSKLHSAVNGPGCVPASHDKFYYHFCPTPGVRIVVLDLYEIALIGYDDCQHSAEYKRAVNLIKSKNPNQNKRELENLPWQDCKYTCINGSVTNIQLQWLVEVLDYATKAHEVCIVAGHNPLCATDKTRYSFISWNNDDVLDILHKYSCVVAYFGGHDLDGGYVQDDHGIHHVTMPGLVETPSCSNAHATVHVFPDRLEVVGAGRCPSMTLYYHGKAKVTTKVRPAQHMHQSTSLALQPVAPPAKIIPVNKKLVSFDYPQPVPVPQMHQHQHQHLVPAPQIHQHQHQQAIGCQPTVYGTVQQPQQTIHIKSEPNIQINCNHESVDPCGPATIQPQITEPAPIPQQSIQVQDEHPNVPTYTPELGNIRRAIPVTIAVPIEKLEAMGGINKFQLAEAPNNLQQMHMSGVNKVWNMDQNPRVVDNTPVFV